ncbi:MAG: uroporphyrinogen-III synthase [Prevotellaceae bacterium]|jgi:uroporphyrinogen-III synthase|nr:uroporphyrinogen-III synthase [Prevotellaceae bacterium]
MKKIKKILLSQPEPIEKEKSPYNELVERYNVQIDFRPFIQVESVSLKEFRKQKIEILNHTAIIFTARTAVDHFFHICEGARIVVPETMKYFCMSETIAVYLQKYIVYRKRKIFFGNGTLSSLIEVTGTVKHRGEKFFLVLADSFKPEIPKTLERAKLKITRAILYRTVSSDLSGLNIKDYDIIAFCSPTEIKSLQSNFPDFEQGDTIFATLGQATAKAVKAAKYSLSIEAPKPGIPSMSKALDLFLKDHT